MEYSIEGGTEVLRGTPSALRELLSGLSEGWLDGDEVRTHGRSTRSSGT
jgi:hypothetical protein